MQTEGKTQPDRYLPIRIVADRLSCSSDHVYDLLAARKLKGIRLGFSRGLRVSAASLAAFLAKAEAEFERDF